MESTTWTQEAIDSLINDGTRQCTINNVQDVKQRIRHALANGYPVNATSHSGRTLLYQILTSIYKSDLSDVALELIEAGADPLQRGVNGWVAGHHAAYNHQLDLCRALGTAWINVKGNGNGDTPLYLALSKLRQSPTTATPVVQYLLPHCTEDILRAALMQFPLLFKDMYDGEMVARRRWTVARAAWIAAAACSL